MDQRVVEQYDCTYTRIDMPGIGKKDLTIWFTKDVLFFKGIAQKEFEHEESRVYEGGIQLSPSAEYFDLDRMSAELKDGVCRLVLPLKQSKE